MECMEGVKFLTSKSFHDNYDHLLIMQLIFFPRKIKDTKSGALVQHG